MVALTALISYINGTIRLDGLTPQEIRVTMCVYAHIYRFLYIDSMRGFICPSFHRSDWRCVKSFLT